jgi:hypothetical protein
MDNVKMHGTTVKIIYTYCLSFIMQIYFAVIETCKYCSANCVC